MKSEKKKSAAAKQKTILGIDLGGSKIALALININNSEILSRLQIPTFENEKDGHAGGHKTKAERTAFLQRLITTIAAFIEEGRKNNFDVLPYVGIGSPGSIVKGKIRPGTTPQMGKSFDNFPIEDELTKALSFVWPQQKLKVVVRNDALAQMAYGVVDLLKTKKMAKKLNGNRVSYIGPGTGLGGGFAWITCEEGKPPKLDFFTDGHISDIIVGRDEQNGPLWAEFEYISGIYIAKRTNGLTGKDLAKDIDTHREFIIEMGQNLGKLIELIHRGDVYKARASTFWTDDDREAVKGTRFFVIGGSIGSKGEMGKIIRREAQQYLDEKLPDKEIEIIPLKADSSDAGVLGAAYFVLPLVEPIS